MEIYAMLALVGFGYMFSRKPAPGPALESGARYAEPATEMAMHRQYHPDMSFTAARNAELRAAQELERAPNYVWRPGADNPFSRYGEGKGGGKTTYSTLAGTELTADEFRHNNMLPHFGSRLTGINPDSDTGRILETFQGASGPGNSAPRVEPGARFTPAESAIPSARGTPMIAAQDGMIDRYTSSLSMTREGLRPFQPVNVGPGLGAGFTADPSGGRHQNTLDYIAPKNVDELRSALNPRLENPGVILPGSGPSQRGIIGEFAKNRPETAFESDRYTAGARGGDRPVLPQEVLMPMREDRGDTFRLEGGKAPGGAEPRDAAVGIRGRRLPEDAVTFIGASAADRAPADGHPFAGGAAPRYELGGRLSDDLWARGLGPTGAVVAGRPYGDELPAQVRHSGKVVVQDSGREFGNMSAQIPPKPPAYDPDTYVARTTLKETTVDEARAANLGGQLQQFAGGEGEGRGTRNTIRQGQDAYGHSVRNLLDAAGPRAPRPDAPAPLPPTTRETNSKPHEGFFAPDVQAPGAYAGEAPVLAPTQRQMSDQRGYAGPAGSSDAPGAYAGQLRAMRGADTGTAVTSSGGTRDADFDYYGIPRSDEQRGIDYGKLYNETLNEAKVLALRTRLPGGQGRQEPPGAAKHGLVQVRPEPEPDSYARPAKLPSELGGAGSVHVRRDEGDDGAARRLDPAMVDWVASNPYVATGVWSADAAAPNAGPNANATW